MNEHKIDLQKWLSDEQYQLLQLINNVLWDTDLRIIARLRKRNAELEEKLNRQKELAIETKSEIKECLAKNFSNSELNELFKEVLGE